MLPIEYLVALCTVFGMVILMFFAFRKAPTAPVLPKGEEIRAKQSASASKKKKSAKTREAEKEKENKEVEAILQKELSRKVGLSIDASTTQPETIGEVPGPKKRAAAQPKQNSNASPAPTKKQQHFDVSSSFQNTSTSSVEDGFKPVTSSQSRLQKKKEKPRTEPKEFEIDEEMEKKLAAFFSRSDRRNKAGLSLTTSAVQGDAEPRGSYVRVKEEFSIDSKW